MAKMSPPACEANARPQPGQRQHNGLPCICLLDPGHEYDHRCHQCESEWPNTRDPLDIVERVAIVGVQPGDVLVFEARADASEYELDAVARRIQHVLGDQTLSIVINGRLGGVLRREGNVLVETTSFNDHARGRRTYLVGDEPR